MTVPSTGWAEDDSRSFIDLGEIIVPSRAEQLDIISALVPARENDTFCVVDLACGAGLLSAALLRSYPHACVVALDGSPEMLNEARKNLTPYGNRAEFRLFDLRDRTWLSQVSGEVRAFVSSLAIHHLDGSEKQQFFSDIHGHLPDGGALLIADIVEPVNEWVRETYAVAWDAVAKEQSLGLTGSLDAYLRFRDGWNHYVSPDVDFDKPSVLFEQLKWLRQAGFSQVDCFWLRAGHAIYGGYR